MCALFELIDALLLTLDPRSPVELSLSPAFRRRYSMVYDALQEGQVAPDLARQLLAAAEPAKAAGVLGISFITEGAIPFAARDPLRVIPSLMIGSAGLTQAATPAKIVRISLDVGLRVSTRSPPIDSTIRPMLWV